MREFILGNIFSRLEPLVSTASCSSDFSSGWHPPHVTIDEFSVQDARDLMDLNFFSYFIMCKLCLPHIRKVWSIIKRDNTGSPMQRFLSIPKSQVQGNIINMSSLVGVQGQLRATTYCATKGECLLCCYKYPPLCGFPMLMAANTL